MGKLFAIAGRPLSGKTEFMKNMETNFDENVLFISALNFNNFEELVQQLSLYIRDKDCERIIAIDNFEEFILKQYKKANYLKYKDHLNILALLIKNKDIDIYVSVGLKRQADRGKTIYCSYSNLRSRAIYEETDGILFLRQRGM